MVSINNLLNSKHVFIIRKYVCFLILLLILGICLTKLIINIWLQCYKEYLITTFWTQSMIAEQKLICFSFFFTIHAIFKNKIGSEISPPCEKQYKMVTFYVRLQYHMINQ